MKKRVAIIIGIISLVGCGSGGSSNSVDTEDESSSPIGTKAPIAIYNQAYQENFDADTIDEIIDSAKNGYVLVDPFMEEITPNHISKLKEKNNQVGGYISVGTGEDWRDDFEEIEPYLTTKVWDEWEGEYYVSQTTTGIVDVMKKRIDKMADWGIEWVEFDNMDWFDEDIKNQYNLETTQTEATTYINTLCNYTHLKGMKCMAKNSVEGFENFDGVLYESYHNKKNWWDEDGTKSFLRKDKLVIINHYNEKNCDTVYEEFQDHYNTHSISFICEDIGLKKYKHYNE